MKTPKWLIDQNIIKNQEEYGVKYNFLHFPTIPDAREKLSERDQLIEAIGRRALWTNNATKADGAGMSEGCRICGEGTWSCLFINGICNSRCFYCPSPQHTVGEPETNSLIFPDPKDYVDYIRKFRFRGVSISGGEPLITFEKSLSYIEAVRQSLGDSVYIWLYTNGKLFDAEKAAKLAGAGLNEIRFDIGATDYDLSFLKKAVGRIPVVTVEIPAIPEDLQIMKEKMKEMKSAGVNHLNLHQLRLTPSNFNNLIEKDYTFIHGEKVTVLESELTALKLLLYGKDENIGQPVNYCSFVYKNRFQKSAARKRHAAMVVAPEEAITGNGFIRRLKFSSFSEESEALFFPVDQLGKYLVQEGSISVQYFISQISPSPGGLHEYRQIPLNDERSITLEKRSLEQEFTIRADEIDIFIDILNGKSTEHSGLSESMSRILAFEQIPQGLQDYY